jgi:hypothetical protein
MGKIMETTELEFTAMPIIRDNAPDFEAVTTYRWRHILARSLVEDSSYYRLFLECKTKYG